MNKFLTQVLIIVCLSQAYFCNFVFSEEQNKIKLPPKVILVIKEDPESPTSRAYGLFYSEVSKRIGITIDLVPLPGKRASLYSDSGKFDGEAARASIYSMVHPEMVRVQEHITTVTFSAYAVKPSIKLQGWESLRNTDFRVEFTRGSIINQMLAPIVKKENLSVVNSRVQGLKKLMIGRTDVFIVISILTNPLLKLPQFKDSKIYIAGDMQTVQINAFLNKKHKALEPIFSAAFKEIKEEGLIEQYIKTAFGI